METETLCICLDASSCGYRVIDFTISLTLVEGAPGFCTNRHYVEWWNPRHPGSPMDASQFGTPEKYYEDEAEDL